MINYNKTPKYHKDDLLLPQSTRSGGISKVVDFVKRTEDATLQPVNIAVLLYHCGKEDVREPIVIEGIERNLVKFSGQFKPRWAFGALYGMYRTNAGSLKGIEFFEKEFLSIIAETSRTEAVELVEALSYCTQLPKTHKFNFIKENLQPVMIAQWKKLQYQVKYLLVLLKAIVRLEYYDQELCDMLFQALMARKTLKKFEVVLDLYVLFKELDQSGKFPRELTSEIDHWKNLLLKKDDLTWRYNVEQGRFYTYDELKSIREDFQFQDQYLEYTDPQLSQEDEQRRLEMEQEEEEERLREERDARLNEIVRDRYMSMLRGDVDMEEEENLVFNEKEAEDMKTVAIEDEGEDEEEHDAKNKKKSKQKQKGKGKGKGKQGSRDDSHEGGNSDDE